MYVSQKLRGCAKKLSEVFFSQNTGRNIYYNMSFIANSSLVTSRNTWAISQTKALFNQHNLHGWKVGISYKMTSSAGLCNYTKKIIKLSGCMLRSPNWTNEMCLNTIRHEVAHAICGYKHNHDNVWKCKAIEIGCDGKRCHTVKF